MNPRRLLLLLPEVGVVKVILLKRLLLLLLLLLGQGLLEILIVDSTGHLLLLLGLSHGCGIEYAWRLGW